MKARNTVALALSATLVASGCGGSSKTLTRSQLVAKADPICAQANAKLREVFRIQHWDDIPAAAAAFATYAKHSSAEMMKLKAPSSIRGDWAAIIGGYQAIGQYVGEMGERAKVTKKPEAALVAKLTTTQGRLAVTGGRSGFKACGKI